MIDHIHDWIATIVVVVGVVAMFVRNDQSVRDIKRSLEEATTWRKAHDDEHRELDEKMTRHDEKIGNLVNETQKDHERVRDLQIRSGAPRDPGLTAR